MTDATAITTARLDRIERMLNDLLTNREEMLDVLGLIRRSLETKHVELTRLERIEGDLAAIRRHLGAAAPITGQREETRRLHLV